MSAKYDAKPAELLHSTGAITARRTKVWVDLERTGASQIRTGIGFLDHTLKQLAKHRLINLTPRDTVLGQGERDAVDLHRQARLAAPQYRSTRPTPQISVQP